jgi:hypothetical protein
VGGGGILLLFYWLASLMLFEAVFGACSSGLAQEGRPPCIFSLSTRSASRGLAKRTFGASLKKIEHREGGMVG